MLTKASRDDYLKLHTVTSKVYHAPPKQDGPVGAVGFGLWPSHQLGLYVYAGTQKATTACFQQHTPPDGQCSECFHLDGVGGGLMDVGCQQPYASKEDLSPRLAIPKLPSMFADDIGIVSPITHVQTSPRQVGRFPVVVLLLAVIRLSMYPQVNHPCVTCEI